MPFAAGGPTDRVARDLAEAMRKPLGGQPSSSTTGGGAGGSIGANKVAKAPPDGYTLLVHHIGMGTMPTLDRNIPFKVEDFEYLGMINDVPMTLIGKPTLPANNYKELLWLEANKGKINLANAGLGSASHLCGLLFQTALKIDMTPVPYKGTAPAMTDLIGGQVDLMCDQTTNTTGQIEGGKVKAFAVTYGQAPDDAGAEGPADAGRGRPEGLQRHHLARPVRTQGHTAGGADKLNDALQGRAEGPRLHQAQEGLGAVVVTDNRVERRRTQEVRRGRDRQVGADHQGRGPVRRLIAARRPQSRTVIGMVTGRRSPDSPSYRHQIRRPPRRRAAVVRWSITRS